jgi:hypothetical protein
MNTNEPSAAVLPIFDQIINSVNRAVPVRSDNKPFRGEAGSNSMLLMRGMPVGYSRYVRSVVVRIE